MGHPTKIATCCYCGTRAVLVLRGKDSHELSCRSCGAPLHNMKMLPMSAVAHHRDNPRLPAMKTAKQPPKSSSKPTPERPVKKKSKKKRKSKARWLFEEAYDFIEDIFD